MKLEIFATTNKRIAIKDNDPSPARILYSLPPETTTIWEEDDYIMMETPTTKIKLNVADFDPALSYSDSQDVMSAISTLF